MIPGSTSTGNGSAAAPATPTSPTPTLNTGIDFRLGGFATIAEALDYAAQGVTGYNFFDLRGNLAHAVPYAQLREQALDLAARMAARFERGSRLAVIAETSPDFLVTFFACQYAGMVPAPMPMPVNLGGKDGYINQIRQMIVGSRASAAIGPLSLRSFLEDAASALDDVEVFDFTALRSLEDKAPPIAFSASENCYIQYSSGSTSAPKGVIGTQKSVNANLTAIANSGLNTHPGDRAASWLPLYHDMGLIGFILTPMVAQMSVDFMATSDFVRRPLLWLRIMSEQKTTITYSPSFGYELTAKRAARAEPNSLDLSALRVAGVGGDMVRPEALMAFGEAFAPFKFNALAFNPSYGMAEATLAISFYDLDEPFSVDLVDMRHYTRSGIAQPASALTSPEHQRGFVLCGRALPDHAIEVRGKDGAPMGERVVGRVFITGPSLTPGYFSDPAASAAMFDGDWLDTGDMGYLLNGQIVITGRAKDLIIINGRNIWPQDIEWAVEKLEGVRGGGVAAFSVDNGHDERIIVVVERRGMNDEAQAELKREISKVIQNAAGAPAEVVLARPHSMVMTSSGKLSRAKVKQKYLDGAFRDDQPEAAVQSPRALAEARV